MTPEAMRDARALLGFTQSNLAQALGLTLRSIQWYESGRRPIPRTVELLIDRWLEDIPAPADTK